MRIGNKCLIALVVGVVSISFLSPAFAQKTSKREAAIQDCIAKVATQYPNAVGSAEPAAQATRLAAYRSCMRAAGQRP
jgi:hypothetical protein